MNDGFILTLTGHSGVGKSTLIELVKKYFHNVTHLPSYTTRKIRDYETNGNPYHFVTDIKFNELVNEGKFIEFNEVHGEMYGTVKDDYYRALSEGKLIVKDIDVKGAMDFKNEFKDKLICVYIEVSDITQLTERLNLRGESHASRENRMKRIEFENSYKQEFDHIINNDNLTVAFNQLCQIIEKEYIRQSKPYSSASRTL